MYKLEKQEIFSKDKVQIGIKFILSGEVRYGIELKDLSKLQEELAQLESISKSELILLDLSKLKRWDSLGIKLVIAKILEINRSLSSKGRTLISAIGDKSTDLYAAARDKYPEINDQTFPWYLDYKDYQQVIEN